jgi:hypothetical protein
VIVGGKRLFFAVGVIAMTLMAVSGRAAAWKVAAGSKGGLALASLVGSDAVPRDGWNDKPLCCFNGGVSVVVDFSSVFGIELECLHSNKGVRVLPVEGDSEFIRRYTYVDVPVLARCILTIEHGAPVRQVFFAGPYFGFLRSARESDTCGSGTIDKKDEVKPHDIGVMVGFAAEIDAGPGCIIFDVRYSHGFSSLERTENIRTSVIGVNVGYVFSIFTVY